MATPNVNSAPETLHPTPSPQNPKPYAPNPTPFTLHPTPYTLHPTPYTLNPAPYTPYPEPCTLHEGFESSGLDQAVALLPLPTLGKSRMNHRPLPRAESFISEPRF